VVLYDDRNNFGEYQIFYKRSTDGGLNWDSDTQLSTALPYSGFPSVAASGSVVHVVYEDDRNGNGDIYYKRSADGGQTWGADTRLTTNPHDSWDPCVSVSDSVVHVIWMDNRNHSNSSIYDIYYKRSTDGGLSWGPDVQLTNASGDSEYPNLAASGSIVHVVWEDFRDGNYEIYYKQSTDGGITWGADTRLTNAIYPSLQPSIAISGSVLHVVWCDYRDTNYEIYYKRNPTGNLPVGIGNNLVNNAVQQISIWPNPAANSIHINFNNYSNEKSVLTIRNILGEELLSSQTQNSESIIDVSNLQNGIYFVGRTTGFKQTVIAKLIIQK
jgi:predicted neuraminidase